MNHPNSIKAIFTPPQLKRFCEFFELQPNEIEVNFDGWHKHVLLVRDTVFLFPRTPEWQEGLQKELDLYAAFAHLDAVPLPKLKSRVKDKEISCYEFGAVSRLKGKAFSGFIGKLTCGQLKEMLIRLADVVAAWHDMPVEPLPAILPGKPHPAQQVNPESWPQAALDPAQTPEAVAFIRHLTEQHTGIRIDAKTGFKWQRILAELARLDTVLIHGDLHEDQILVDPQSLEITGIVDWETARIGNPVWDFNFGEWGKEIWRHTADFMDIRSALWNSYLKKRNLNLSTDHGLHLFYTLVEFCGIIRDKSEKNIPITQADFGGSLEIYRKKLEEMMELDLGG